MESGLLLDNVFGAIAMTKQVKSKQRVVNHGEVFTASREVNAMLNLVEQETERVDSRFLEPACGDGNFVVEILRRKLNAARKRATPPNRKRPIPLEFEKQSVIAVASIYGVDLMMDNVLACRERLYEMWNEEYEMVCKKEVNEDCREAVKFILSRNIVCGNALSLKMVDDDGNDLEEPIVFSEWSFIMERKMQRKDYRFDKMLAGEYVPKVTKRKKSKKNVEAECYQMNLLSMMEEKPSAEGEFLKSYVADYRRIQDYGE